MSESERLSGRAQGEEYLRRMDAYLQRIVELPLLNGSLNVKAIAESAGIPTQSVYKNPAIRALLEAAKHRLGVQSWSETRKPSEGSDRVATAPSVADNNTKTRRLERRISTLEQQNSALVAENYELRQKLKSLQLQLGREDMIIESGRRIATPTVA